MAWVQVASYYLRYNTKQSQCVVGVHFREGGSADSKMIAQHFNVSASDAIFLADMLRNEKPIFLEPETGALATAKEEVGEEERTSP